MNGTAPPTGTDIVIISVMGGLVALVIALVICIVLICLFIRKGKKKTSINIQREQRNGREERERGDGMDIEYNLPPVIQPVLQHNIREIEPPAASPRRNLQNGSQKPNPKSRSLVQNKKPEADRKLHPRPKSLVQNQKQEAYRNVRKKAPIAIAPSKIPRSVGAPVTFEGYCEKEWHGFTENAQRVRNGYRNLSTLGYSHLLSIRGDNYSAMRSTLFQRFCMRNISDCPLLASIRDPLSAQLIVPPMFERYPFLKKWSFANKKEFHKLGEPLETLKLCIGTLAYEVNTIRSMSQIDRMVYIYMKLNSQPEMFDFSLMEALKFYMFIQAAEYWESYSNGQPVPELMDILFLREDCMNLEDFVLKRLNNVGDGGELEMIEMFLLGYTLGVQIRVIRISSFGKEDYLSFYPHGDYPQEKVITISAEDDRHYNAVASLDPTFLGEFYIPANATRIQSPH